MLRCSIIIGGSYSDEKNEMAGKNSIGFEVLKKFSNKKGDWASFLLQMRFLRYDRQSMLMNKTQSSHKSVIPVLQPDLL